MGMFIGVIGMLAIPVALIILVIKAFRKKPKKGAVIALVASFCCFVLGGIITMTEPVDKYLVEDTPPEPTPSAVLAQNELVSSEEPVSDDDKILNETQVSQEEAEKELEIVRAEKEEAEKQLAAMRAAEKKRIEEKEAVTFDEIYKAFKSNELVAKDKYNGNRYKITAKINGMSSGGLFNLTGGATLTMEKRVDNTVVFFYAEFEKEQENALKKIVVGDTITFEGECRGGNFDDCEIVN